MGNQGAVEGTSLDSTDTFYKRLKTANMVVIRLKFQMKYFINLKEFFLNKTFLIYFKLLENKTLKTKIVNKCFIKI